MSLNFRRLSIGRIGPAFSPSLSDQLDAIAKEGWRPLWTPTRLRDIARQIREREGERADMQAALHRCRRTVDEVLADQLEDATLPTGARP